MQIEVEYNQAIKTKYPEQVVFAIAKDRNGKANPITIGWTMIASGDPAMMAIALSPKRYTTDAIRHSKSFTLVFPSADMVDLAMLFGTKSGRDTDKLKEAAVTIEKTKIIDSVILRDATANFECLLESETIAGDHIIFVGRIVASYVNSKPKPRLYTTAPGWKMGPVGWGSPHQQSRL